MDEADPSELPPDVDSDPADDLAAALAHGYGGTREPGPGSAPSVLARIAELSGPPPAVHLRDETAGDTPMLRPLAGDERRLAGKYVVQGELGRGGVGAVHRGHDQDLGRDVAMKFLHERYQRDPGLLHRFVEEAQIGGQLQHPGIVPVYDLGLVDGRPFFTMKLVKGQTLAKKLAERASPAEGLPSFLAIFEDVCQTLAYAHARGVVHRDLKPANVMIGSFGEVQVVDWGMGKVLSKGGVADERLTDERRAELRVVATVRTSGHGSRSVVGSIMGTPAYMPPEQARGDVEHMDERSDVFALGAILCEILTGAPPYVGEAAELIGMAASAELDDALARLAACEAEPEMAALAERCLAPAPAARPRSAEVVARAVHEHLAAVEERVHTARVEAAEAKVRAAALVRTRALGTGLALVFAVGLVASLWFWRDASVAAEKERIARKAADDSAAEAHVNEQRAEHELARAVEIKSLLAEMLTGITPEQARAQDTQLLRSILETASSRVAEGSIPDPRVAAEIQSILGSVYLRMGLFDQADKHLTPALAVFEQELGPDHPDTLACALHLGALRGNQSRRAEAEALIGRVVEADVRLFGPEDPRTLEARSQLAFAHYLLNEHVDEAGHELEQVIELQRRVLGPTHRDTLASVFKLSQVYQERGRFAANERLLGELVGEQRMELGEDHPDTLRTEDLLARTYLSLGRPKEAEQLFRATIPRCEKVFGPDHYGTLSVRSGLASADCDLGQWDEAVELARDVAERSDRTLGPEHREALSARSYVASVLYMAGRYDEAEPLFRKALSDAERLLGDDDPLTLSILADFGSLYQGMHRYEESLELQLRALESRRRVLGEEHFDTESSKYNLANLYSQMGRKDDSEPLWRELLDAWGRRFPDPHPQVATVQTKLGLQLSASGRLDEAEPLLRAALETRKAVLGPEHEQTLGAMTNLGNLYNRQHGYEEAVEILESSLAIKRRVLGLDHEYTRAAMGCLVDAYKGLGRTEDAFALWLERRNLQLADLLRSGASAPSLNEAAWSLLTHEDERQRDPKLALQLARQACALEEDAATATGALWACLDTLALALFRTGDVEGAIENQHRAMELAPADAQEQLAEPLNEYERAAREK